MRHYYIRVAYIEKKSLEDFVKLVKIKESIVVTGHKGTDGDCLEGICVLTELARFVNPDAEVYPITDVTEQMTEDTAELIKKYSIEVNYPKTVKFDKTPDLMILVDNQIGTNYTIIPKGIPLTEDGKVAIDISCWDHHPRLEEEYYSDFRDSSVNSTAGIIMNVLLSNGNEQYLDIVKNSPYLCTIGYQALIIDTGLQENLIVGADRLAHDYFQKHGADLVYLKNLNENKISPATAAILGKAYEPNSCKNIKDIATFCYIPRITEGKSAELAIVARGILKITTSLQTSIAIGIVDEKDDKENVLRMSIRSDAPNRIINALKIAKVFGSGGEEIKAGAQLKLGLLKYSCNTEEFKELISDEIESRLVDSDVYEGEDKPQKPVFQTPTPLEDLLKDNEIEVDLAPHIVNAGKNYAIRGNNHYLTLCANRNLGSENGAVKLLKEEDIPALIATGEFYLDTFKKSKKYKSCSTSFVYGLISGGVDPYIIGIMSTINGKKDNKDFDPESISSKIFGNLIYDIETVETETLKRAVIRIPLPSVLNYTKEHQYIHKIVYNEIEERLRQNLGEKSSNSISE